MPARVRSALGRVPVPVAWLVGGFLALLACLLVLGALADEVAEQEANALDAFANPFLHGLASPGLDAAMGAATFMGSTPAIPLLLLAAGLGLIAIRRRREALFLVAAIGGSFALNQLLKLVVHRPRPQLAWAQVQPEFSFPSGHTQNGLVFYLALALIVWVIAGRRAGVVAVAAAAILAVLIGVSRIYFGFHYLTDVVGGYFAGLAWLLIVAAAFRAGPMLRAWRTDADPGEAGPAPANSGRA